MAEDWSIDVRKYVPDADGDIIAGIVRYCGIALRNKDSSLVAFSDKTETDRVKANFLRKKLALTDADDVLDAAIAAVGDRMKADRTKNRVTVYYLLADAFGRLEDFRPKGKPTKAAVAAPLAAAAVPKAAPVVKAPVAVAPEPIMAPPPPAAPPPPQAPPVAPVLAATAAPQPVMAATPARRPAPAKPRNAGLLLPLVAGVALFGAVAAMIVMGPSNNVAAPAAPAAPAALAAPVAVPDGAGVTEQVVEGRPQVSIYFDTGKADLDASFGGHTQAVRDWLDANPGHHLVVSGYNDPRGDAALNAALSKARAFAVRDALVGQGIGTDQIDLVKPANTNLAETSFSEARRVDVTIADGPVPEGESAAKPSPNMP